MWTEFSSLIDERFSADFCENFVSVFMTIKTSQVTVDKGKLFYYFTILTNKFRSLRLLTMIFRRDNVCLFLQNAFYQFLPVLPIKDFRDNLKLRFCGFGFVLCENRRFRLWWNENKKTPLKPMWILFDVIILSSPQICLNDWETCAAGMCKTKSY